MAINGLGYVNQVNRTNSSMQTSLRKIASGSQHPTAASGAAEYAISQRMTANIGAAHQSLQNTQTANSMLTVAAGGVQSTVNALGTLRDKLLQAANGTNTDGDRATIAQTLNQTVATINENASIQYNGKNLLDGSASITVAGIDGYKNLNIANLSSQGLGLTDENGNSTLDLSSTEGINAALDKVDAALNTALDQGTEIGAAQQELGFSAGNYVTQTESLTAAEGANDDTDMAAEITKLRSSQTLNQMAMFAQKMFMNQQGAALNLLR